MCCLQRDYLDNLFSKPEGYPYPTCEWILKCDSYAVDLQDASPIMPVAAVMQPTAKRGSSAVSTIYKWRGRTNASLMLARQKTALGMLAHSNGWS